MATALSGDFQTHSVFFGVGFYYSLYPMPEPARHPYRNPLGYCRNESPVLQLSHETAGGGAGPAKEWSTWSGY